MSTAWHKVVRDVWRERVRGMLVVLAIALGLAAIDGRLAMLLPHLRARASER